MHGRLGSYPSASTFYPHFDGVIVSRHSYGYASFLFLVKMWIYRTDIVNERSLPCMEDFYKAFLKSKTDYENKTATKGVYLSLQFFTI